MAALDEAEVRQTCMRVLSARGAEAMSLTGRQLREAVAREMGADEAQIAAEWQGVLDDAFLEFIQPFLSSPADDDSAGGEKPPSPKKARAVQSDGVSAKAKPVPKPKAAPKAKNAPKAKVEAKVEAKKNGAAKASKAQPPAASQSEDEGDGPRAKRGEDPLARLKKYVAACGVRRVWKRELEGMSARAARTHIEGVLASLGVDGRPTLEKCREVKARREREEELRALDPSNVIPERLRSQRSGGSQDAVGPASSDDSETEQPRPRFNLLAYGDPDDL